VINGLPERRGLAAALWSAALLSVTGGLLSCHAANLALSLSGPHGLHNVGDSRWVISHEIFFGRDPVSCRPCHGADLRGTVLSRAAADRTFQVEGRTVSFKKGTSVACNLCHGLPGGG
jgi:hypothetical protein